MAVKVMQSQDFADDDGSYRGFQQEVKVRGGLPPRGAVRVKKSLSCGLSERNSPKDK